MEKTEAYFTRNFETALGRCSASDETTHPEFQASLPHHSLTETQYFSFSIPEENIHAFLYLWYHPNLNVVSGGPIVFQGKKPVSLGCEIFDYMQYLPASQLSGGLINFKLENSYSVEMLEPGRVFRLCYDDPARKNRFDLLYTAVSDHMVWPSNRHFEQVMRVDGELILRGRPYHVGGLNIRDRSWGEVRFETPNPGPPITWSTASFGEDFAFNITAHDHPERGPIWKDVFMLEPEKALKFGWMIVDGEPVAVREARNLTRYDRATMMPDAVHMEITDVRGRVFEAEGKVVAATPLNTWLNLRVPICMTRWICNGRVGWGEMQGAQWTDFLYAFSPSATSA